MDWRKNRIMINFTKENESELRALIADSTLNKIIYSGPMGQEYDVWDLVNTMAISSLRTLSQFIQNKISKLSVVDDWSENVNTEEVLALETCKRLIFLIIGWKLHQQEKADNEREVARLKKQLDELVQSQKTPTQLIAELEQKIKDLS